MAEVAVVELFPEGQDVRFRRKFKQECKLASLELTDFCLVFALYHHLVEAGARIECNLKSVKNFCSLLVI